MVFGDIMQITKPLLLSLLTCNLTLFALPTGGQSVKGEATIVPSPDGLRIQVNGKAIINWERFDISLRETVSFLQSQSKDIVLNRVLTGPSSQILGLLEANCPIYLINPQGVFIGSSAKIDTAGFLATTADISNEAFWQGSELFFGNLGPGKIVNLGTIASAQGDVYLIARAIDNSGKITAPEGVVSLTTSEVMIHPTTKQTIFIRLSEDEEGIKNSGEIQALAAEFKTGSPYEKAIHHTGIIEAVATVEREGKVYLVADRGETFVDGSISAPSGQVRILGKDVHLDQNALIDVSGGHGGTILVGGDYRGSNSEIANAKTNSVAKGARLLADGWEEDAGRVILWGDEATSCHGQISCQGLGEHGDGGFVEISVKSNHLDYRGDVSTRAKNGKTGTLLFDPVDITISNTTGTTGGFTNPYDPSGVATANLYVGDLNTALGSNNVLIESSGSGGGGGNIVFATGTTTTWAFPSTLTAIAYRTLTVNGTISATNGGAVNFTTQGLGVTTTPQEGLYVSSTGRVTTDSGDITFNGTGISGAVGVVNQCSGVAVDGVVQTANGTINFIGITGTPNNGNQNGVMIRGQVTSTSSGNINMTGTSTSAGVTGGNNGLIIRGDGPIGNPKITSMGTGNITLIGTSACQGLIATGFEMAGDNTTATCQALGSGNITIIGTLSTGPSNSGQGVQIATRSTLSSNSGTISITGINNGQGTNNPGVFLTASSIIESNSGPINIIAQTTVSSGSSSAFQVAGGSFLYSTSGNITANAINSSLTGNTQLGIQVSQSQVVNTNGNIQMTGQARGSAGNPNNRGLQLDTASVVESLGTGMINLNGTGGAGTNTNWGILIYQSTVAALGTGPIQMTGIGGGSGTSADGIAIEVGGKIMSTNGGSITLNGTGSPVGTTGNGIIVTGTSSAVTSTSGNIQITGTGNGIGASSTGLSVTAAGSISSTTTGAITISNAQGSLAGTSSCHGVFVDGIGSKITSSSGAIEVTGTAGGTGNTNEGIRLSNGGIISSNSGPIVLAGTGSVQGTSSNEGIFMRDSSTAVSSVNGPITMTGTAGGGTTNGTAVTNSAAVKNTNSGKITVNSPNTIFVNNNASIETLGTGPGNDISVQAGAVNLTAGSLGPALISTTNGDIGVNTTGNVSLTGGTNAGSNALIQSTTHGDINANAMNLIVQGGSNNVLTGIQTAQGNISVTCVQDCLYTAPTAGALGVMRTFGSDLTVIAGDSINLSGYTIFSTPNPGNLLLIAGNNISIGTNTQVIADGTTSSSLTLVVDNDFPTAPGIGLGQFILEPGGLIMAGAGIPVKVYTARRSQNTVGNSINGSVFTPGPFEIDSNIEQWGTYYPGGTYQGTPFKIYYKELNPLASKPAQALLFTNIAANLVTLPDLLPVIKMPPLIRLRSPSYHFKICQFIDRKKQWRYCDPIFSPYGSFIFEDDVYWIDSENRSTTTTVN